MDVVQIISNVGVPTAAFLISFAFIRYMYDKSMALIAESMKSVSELTNAVNSNTETLSKLTEKIGTIKEKEI